MLERYRQEVLARNAGVFLYDLVVDFSDYKEWLKS